MHALIHRLLFVTAVIAAAAARTAGADVLLDQTTLVGSATVPAPSQYSFTAATAQALTLTLTDLKIPAAFGSLQVAVTLGDALVGSASVAASGTATLSIPSAAGNYTLYVIGAPDLTQGVGSFGVCVAPAGSAKSCIAAYSFSGNIVAPGTASSTGTSTLNTNFTSTVAGSYSVIVTDDAFPAPLQSIAGGISLGSTPVSSLAAGTTSVTLAAGTSYQLILAANADSVTQAGLYGVQITDPTGAVVFARTLPVGLMPPATIVDNTSAQPLNLTLTDFDYPAALANVGVAVTVGGSPALASLLASGAVTNFNAPAGSIDIWQFAAAGGQPGVFAVSLAPFPATSSAVPLFSATKVVNPAASMATSYAFIATLPSAGTYHLAVTDFAFPFPFQSLGSTTVAQNGTVLTQTSAGDFTAAAGAVVVLVSPTAPQGGDGIFDVTVETSGASPQVLLDQTQAVGGAFNTTSVNLGTSGNYTVTLTDLGFPSSFQYLAVVASQGGQVLGKIYTDGAFNFNATPGQYVFTFITTPSTAGAQPGLDNYGLYSVNVSSSVPTLKFTAASSSVSAGQTVPLTWSSQNATSCSAGGATGWTGTEATSGTTNVQIDATVTLTLTCSGPGGSAAQSLTVAATAAAAKSGGGGGALDGAVLAVLAGVLVAGAARRGIRRA